MVEGSRRRVLRGHVPRPFVMNSVMRTQSVSTTPGQSVATSVSQNRPAKAAARLHSAKEPPSGDTYCTPISGGGVKSGQCLREVFPECAWTTGDGKYARHKHRPCPIGEARPVEAAVFAHLVLACGSGL